MKLILVTLALVACASAVPTYQDQDVLYAKRQQDVWDILKYINNPIYNQEHVHIAESYSPEANAHHYKNNAYQEFAQFRHDTFLKKGEIFSVFDVHHVQQVKALYKLFLYADSYETFYKTALWARHHLNEGLFLYTYSVAIVHRHDTQGLILPPIYEIYPHYFFNSEVLQKAYKLKMGYHSQSEESHNNHEVFTIYSNYSGHYLNLDPEQSLSYYFEDVGINAFYFYFNLYYPYWLSSQEFHVNHHNRGELFYYLHKQLYARYHLERISHGVGEVEYFNWDLPFKTGYYPSLTYPNGLAFPERPHFANLRDYLQHYGQQICDKTNYGVGYDYVQTYEQRIREAIDSGFVIDHEGNKHNIYTKEGIDILGNIIEGNVDSPNHQYYGSFVNFARHLIGYSKVPYDHHKLAPSALEHYITSLRDPAFYQIFKKVFLLVDQYKQNLPFYHYKHLYQEGLKVEQVDIEPLTTYYDHFYSDITNGLYVSPAEYKSDSFKVRVHQYRLNHENFNYKVHVKSQKDVTAVVKVFLGPKYDEHGRPLQLSQVHDKAYEFDHFVYNLKAGKNVIQRNSADYELFVKDSVSYFDVHKHMVQSEHSEQPLDSIHHVQYGFPLRYKLPRGSEEGTTFQMYVIVYPYVPHEYSEVHNNHLPNFVQIDNYPMGYPFDRPTEHEDVYFVPNAYVKYVKVYHQVNKAVHDEEYHEHNDEQKNYHQEVEYAHHNSEQKAYHDDEYPYVQHGDHNNYRQYHHQEYVSEHDNHHDQVEEHSNVDVYVGGNKYKRFNQDVVYQGKHQSVGDDYEHHVPQVYEHEYPRYDAPVSYGKHYDQHQYGDYQKVYNQGKHSGNKYHGGFEYPVKDVSQYVPYQRNYGNEKAYRASDYQSVDVEHHYKPYHHY